MLKVAAIIGRTFAYDLLNHTLMQHASFSETALTSYLETLDARELVLTQAPDPDPVYAFKHLTIWDIAYQTMSYDQRRRLHQDVACWYESAYSDDPSPVYALLAYHWNGAEDAERATHYLLLAGDAVRQLYALPEAIEYYQQALALLRQGNDYEQTARTLMKLGLTYHLAFDYRSAREAYEEGFDLWQRAGKSDVVTTALPAARPLRVDCPYLPLTLDPALAGDIDTVSVLDQLYSGLVSLGAGLEVTPDVARRWEIIDEGRLYVFYLRQDVRWSDGRPLTAADFEYAWRRVLDPALESPVASTLYDVQGARAFHQGETSAPDNVAVRAIDEHTLVVRLEQPTGYFLYLLAFSASYPVPRHVVEAHGADWTRAEHLVTNGPFRGDDDLDLAVGNWSLPTVIYRNDGAGELVGGWNTMESRLISSIAWSDFDGDDDLDMVAGAGAADQGIHLYTNQAPGFFPQTTLQEAGATMGLTWGDYDHDGDPDLAVESSAMIYTNMRLGGEGMPNSAPQLALAWPDGSGGADFYASSEILNDSIIPIPYTLYDAQGEPVGRIEASYSLNGGGNWHPAVAASGTLTTNVPTTALLRESRVYSPSQAISDGPGGVLTANLPVTHTGAVADIDVWLTITHTRDADLQVALVSPAGTSVTLFSGLGGAGQGFLGTVLDNQAANSIISGTAPFTGIFCPQNSLASLFGQNISGTWQLVVTDLAAGQTGSLAGWGLRIRPRPVAQTFLWDTFASSFFGQSDNVVFRLQAYPAPEQGGDAGSYHYSDSGAAPYQWTSAFATTLPFRARGTQVRVLSGTVPVEGAVVYRIPAGQSGGGEPLADPSGQPYTTDAAGYLRGRGTVAISDTLVVLLPVSTTDTYVLYHTNATPTPTGLQGDVVVASGVQTLTVSANHPLMLFNLDVSLQWDARNDTRYQAPFEFNLQRASELLYDWSDGQAALGQVTIYHDREHWNEAQLRVYASNRRRPSAVQGGIVGDVISDTDILTITYAPGQVHMGAVWNRYGEAGTSLGEDWARTLAHELGHYAFFLDDNYLGLDDAGQVIPVDTCPGAMADPYRQDFPYDEFHPDGNWLAECERTLSHQTTGRSDWATMSAFYPWLDGTLGNVGPSGLPLEVTQLTHVAPVTPSAALEDPTFYLAEDGARVQPAGAARGVLYQDNWAVDLGGPTLDHIVARGARPGDEVCVYDPDAGRLGCETVSATDEQLALTTFSGWRPDVAVTPVDSTTLNVQVSNVPTDVTALHARLYPMTAPAAASIALSATVDGYSGTFHLAAPAFEGYVRVWAEEGAPRRELVTDYAVGGNPVSMRGMNVSMRGMNAPVTSADGQMILFVDASNLGADEFYTLQAATSIPAPLPWASVIGQAYRLSASQQAPDLAGASISFVYMGDDVPPGGEPWLRIYYWDGMSWQQLPTALDVYYNNASAPVQGEGLYALMASVELPLYGPGWNLVSYPLYTSRPVTEAMLSLSGHFTTVYTYDAADAADPWKMYDVTVPAWANDLETLQYNHGYWINATATVTWSLPIDAETSLRVERRGQQCLPLGFRG